MTAVLPARSYYDHPCGIQARHLAVCMDWSDGTAACYLWRRGRKPGEPLLSDLGKAMDTLRFFDDDPGLRPHPVDLSAGRPAAVFCAWVASPQAEAFYAGLGDEGRVARACDLIIQQIVTGQRKAARAALVALIGEVSAPSTDAPSPL